MMGIKNPIKYSTHFRKHLAFLLSLQDASMGTEQKGPFQEPQMQFFSELVLFTECCWAHPLLN